MCLYPQKQVIHIYIPNQVRCKSPRLRPGVAQNLQPPSPRFLPRMKLRDYQPSSIRRYCELVAVDGVRDVRCIGSISVQLEPINGDTRGFGRWVLRNRGVPAKLTGGNPKSEKGPLPRDKRYGYLQNERKWKGRTSKQMLQSGERAAHDSPIHMNWQLPITRARVPFFPVPHGWYQAHGVITDPRIWAALATVVVLDLPSSFPSSTLWAPPSTTER